MYDLSRPKSEGKTLTEVAAVVREGRESIFLEQSPLYYSPKESGTSEFVVRSMWEELTKGSGSIGDSDNTGSADDGNVKVGAGSMFSSALLPSWLDLLSVNFWLGRVGGGKRKESPLHFDPKENILIQLAGRKRFVLFSPFDTHNLHPLEMEQISADLGAGEKEGLQHNVGKHKVINFSPVNINEYWHGEGRQAKRARRRFPLFRRARPMTCDVPAGSALFVPSYTWHNVYSWPANDVVDPAEGANIAINFWFAPAIRQHFHALYDGLFEVLLTSNAQIFRQRRRPA